MTLTDPAFTHPGPTRDTDQERWVACDESGWDGEQLLNGSRYLVYASVAIDDTQAAPIVEHLREDTGTRQSPELKFRLFKDRSARRAALGALWGPGGALEDRCSVYLVDKHYAIAAKAIDLLLEEQEHAAGRDLYADGRAQHMARTLASQGRRALREAGHARLLKAFVALASARGRKDPEAAVKHFYQELETAWAASTRKDVTDILFQLRATRSHADLLYGEDEPFGMLEMLIPALAQAARYWAARIGPVNVLADEQRSFTDQALAHIATQVRITWGATPSSRIRAQPVRALVRGVSSAHPSIQLADLLAGAASAAASHALESQPSDAGKELWPLILPFLDPDSLLP